MSEKRVQAIPIHHLNLFPRKVIKQIAAFCNECFSMRIDWKCTDIRCTIKNNFQLNDAWSKHEFQMKLSIIWEKLFIDYKSVASVQ